MYCNHVLPKKPPQIIQESQRDIDPAVLAPDGEEIPFILIILSIRTSQLLNQPSHSRRFSRIFRNTGRQYLARSSIFHTFDIVSSWLDAWAPEAQEHGLGQRCLQAILSESGWSVRILTKNAAVRHDFDLLERYRDRVLVGLSITATPEKGELIEIIEPNASSIPDRMAAMFEAAALGLRTYAMLCPLLPGIADSPEQIDELVKFAVDCKAEEIFVEPVNPRGSGLRLCQEALEHWGYEAEAEAIGKIRKRQNWSRYVANLLTNVQQSIRRHSDIAKLRFLLYPSRLLPEHVDLIKRDDAGVVWL